MVTLAGIEVLRVDSLPDDLDRELAAAAAEEGFSPLLWLKAQWADGTNRFSEPGEAFFVARAGARLVGVCGLNRDPYARGHASGRLRRLYVLPEFRRRGVGRCLVLAALDHAHGHFDAVNLRTLDPRSAAFFETLGFARVEGVQSVTHTRLVP